MTTIIWAFVFVSFLAGIAAAGMLRTLLRYRKALVRGLVSVARKGGIIGVPMVAYLLFATIGTAQTTLQHTDPLIFVAMQLVVLLPFALILLWIMRHTITTAVMQQGVVAGLLLGMGFLGVALTLRQVGGIRTACLIGLDGMMASLVARTMLRKRQTLLTHVAAICAGVGTLVLWQSDPGQWQTDMLALLTGGIFCASTLHIAQTGIFQHQMRHRGPFFAVVLVTMAGVTVGIAACLGNWPSLAAFSAPDLGIVLYTSVATILAPFVLLSLSKRYHSLFMLAFIAVLWPLASIVFAYTVGSATLAWTGWLGVGLIVLSMLVHAGAVKSTFSHEAGRVDDQQVTRPLPEQYTVDGQESATTNELFLTLLSQLAQGKSQETEALVALESPGQTADTALMGREHVLVQ